MWTPDCMGHLQRTRVLTLQERCAALGILGKSGHITLCSMPTCLETFLYI